MFGPIGGGLTNGSQSPISPSATMGDTKSGGSSTSGITLGNVNLGGGMSSMNLTMVIIALILGYVMVNR